MKIPFIALLLTCVNLIAGEQSWEIVRAATEQVSGQRIKITVTVRNVDKENLIVPASLYDGQDGLALPNSYLWPEDLSMKEAMSVLLSHYYTLNSRTCHGVTKQLTIPPKGEVSFIMYDEIATVGKRLLLVFGDRLGESGTMIIGGLTIPNPKTREQAVDGNPH